MNNEQQKQLRESFPKPVIQSMTIGGKKLQYVGHADVTDRLLTVDPSWTWEPLAFDERGLPAFDERGGLWIKLTVCGLTRLGYGEPQGHNGYDRTKGAIGNAIRNAAMRFGVALDLWRKEETAPVPDDDHVEASVVAMRPDATDDNILDWTARISAAQNKFQLKKIGDEISAFNVPDDVRTELLAMFQGRKKELS